MSNSIYRYKWTLEETATRLWICGLSQSGVQRAFKEGYATAATKPLTDHSFRSTEHELAISGFHIQLAEMCDEHGITLYWRQADLKRFICPDALFQLSYPNLPSHANTLSFTFDMERNPFANYRKTANNKKEPKIIRRIEQYVHHRQSGRAKHEYGFPVYAYTFQFTQRSSLSAVLERVKGFPDFIWLTVDGKMFRTPAGNTHSFLDIL